MCLGQKPIIFVFACFQPSFIASTATTDQRLAQNPDFPDPLLSISGYISPGQAHLVILNSVSAPAGKKTEPGD